MDKETAKRKLNSLLEEIAERMAEVSIVVGSIGLEAVNDYAKASNALEDLAASAT